VVRILTTLPSRLVVHFPEGDVSFPQGNTQDGSNTYLLVLSGTGTFITSQGDILTAAHVVDPPKDQEVTQAIHSEAATEVASYINQRNNAGPQVTTEQVTQQLNNDQLRSDVDFGTAVSEVFFSTDYTGPLSATHFRDVPAEIHRTVDKIKKISPLDEKDTAIIHVPLSDTPSVQLGDSSSVQQQDALTIIGFPGNGDVSNRPTDLFTSSVNKINVSSIKTTDNGAPLIQVGGNVEQGDSGGPALDGNGTVVGIVSFAKASASNTPGGTSFLQASNSAGEMIKELRLDTTPGSFQKLWNEAFIAYSANTSGHWHTAQQKFEQLARRYPQFKAVRPYLDYSREQAKKELTTQSIQQQPESASTPAPTSAPGSMPAIVLTASTILVLLLVGGLLFGVTVRQRKKRSAPAARFAPQMAPPLLMSEDDSLAAFGAPAKASPGLSGLSNTLAPTFSMQPVWLCGHMNRPNARFCSICGEAAPQLPARHRIVEQ
jgi:S1-C subfamily serine protease